MDRNKFFIGAYYLKENQYNEEGVKALADMGVDVLVAAPANKTLLDLCAKYGIKVIASGVFPGWWGDNGQRAGEYAASFDLSSLDTLKDSYPYHEALLGDYPVDEPNVRDFAHINKMICKYREVFPGQLPFVNLYPNYASTLPSPDSDAVSQLGTVTYREHVERYAEEVDDFYICYDSYPFASRFDYYLDNLDDVSSVCRKYGRDMWVIVQTGAFQKERNIKEFQLFWQVNLCLCYGAAAIMHACYQKGWWDEAASCIDEAGNKNCTYYYAQHTDVYLHKLAPDYMKYRNMGVDVIGSLDETEAKIKRQLEDQRSRGVYGGFDEVKLSADKAVLAGFFTAKEGEGRAVMLTATEDPFTAYTVSTVKLNAAGKKLRVHYGEAVFECAGSLSLSLTSGEGAFIEIL